MILLESDWENKKSMIENVTANLTEAVQDQGPDQLAAPLKVCFDSKFSN